MCMSLAPISQMGPCFCRSGEWMRRHLCHRRTHSKMCCFFSPPTQPPPLDQRDPCLACFPGNPVPAASKQRMGAWTWVIYEYRHGWSIPGRHRAVFPGGHHHHHHHHPKGYFRRTLNPVVALGPDEGSKHGIRTGETDSLGPDRDETD